MNSTRNRRTSLLFAALWVGLVVGCQSWKFQTPAFDGDADSTFFIGPETGGAVFANPATFAATNPDLFWESLVDVVGDYFQVKVDQPVRQVGNALIEGRVETYPQSGATYLEPWRRDSAGHYERTHATLQSIRRIGFVRVIPTAQGFLVDVQVVKELEDVPRPDHAVAGVSSFQFSQSVDRRSDSFAPNLLPNRWISVGRDTALEQKIIAQLYRCLNESRY